MKRIGTLVLEGWIKTVAVTLPFMFLVFVLSQLTWTSPCSLIAIGVALGIVGTWAVRRFLRPETVYDLLGRKEAIKLLTKRIEEATRIEHTFFFAKPTPLDEDIVLRRIEEARGNVPIENTRYYTVSAYENLAHICRLFERWEDARAGALKGSACARSQLTVFLLTRSHGELAVGWRAFPHSNVTLLERKGWLRNRRTILTVATREEGQLGERADDSMKETAIHLANSRSPRMHDYFSGLLTSIENSIRDSKDEEERMLRSAADARRVAEKYRIQMSGRILSACRAVCNRIHEQERDRLGLVMLVGSALDPVQLDPRHFDIDLVVVYRDRPTSADEDKLRSIVREDGERVLGIEFVHVETRDGPLKVPPVPQHDVAQFHLLLYSEAEVLDWPAHVQIRRLAADQQVVLFRASTCTIFEKFTQRLEALDTAERLRQLVEGSYGVERCLEIAKNPDNYWFTKVSSQGRERTTGDHKLLYQVILRDALSFETDELRKRLERIWRRLYLTWYATANTWEHLLLATEWVTSTSLRTGTMSVDCNRRVTPTWWPPDRAARLAA